jgi:ATP-binding cassette subfamily B (MDR/TAP) protein 1
VGFAFYLLQSFIGNMIAYQITRKLRLQTFEKYLKMPIRWFDRPNNSSNMLSVKLSTDCQAINGVTSTFIFVLADCLTSVIVGFTMAFIY